VLIIPYQTRFTSGSLPVVTLALILVNALVYFVFQAGDRAASQNAAAYYFSSDLPRSNCRGSPRPSSRAAIRAPCASCAR